MTHASAAVPARDARLAWVIGGSLLSANAVLVLALSGPPLFVPGAGVVLTIVWAIALGVLALGIRRSGSVVARRPLGIAALTVAAVEPLASTVLWQLVPVDVSDPWWTVMLGQTIAVVALAALVVATVVIGRAGAVPHRLRWVPLIVVAVGAGAQIAVQLALVAVSGSGAYVDLTALYFGASTIGTLGVLLLGILAIVFAPRPDGIADRPVQVYPPAS